MLNIVIAVIHMLLAAISMYVCRYDLAIVNAVFAIGNIFMAGYRE